MRNISSIAVGGIPRSAVAKLLLSIGVSVALESNTRADVPAVSPSIQQIEFFEAKVRPLLAQHCFECHGPGKQQGDLRLDSREAFLKGNESGPVIVVGNAGASRLTQVLEYRKDDIQMPPRGRLTDTELATMNEWINAGAFWPSDRAEVGSGPAATQYDWRDPAISRQHHWALQPIKKPEVPAVVASDRVRNPIDAFILAKLEPQGLTLSSQAEPADVIRRAMLDVWGLPPTFEDRTAFANNVRDDRAMVLANQLLDSPLYGQRWARHWLDVARYGDSKGYVFTDEPRYAFAYTYRDWVVNALNADMAYDLFIKNQLAADQINPANDPNLAALGFLTVGRRFLYNIHDITDDRIDVTTRGLMGMTVSCARCHDHKFDPIPTDDYYSLYAVFTSSNEPGELPVIGKNPDVAAVQAYEVELGNRQAAVERRRDELRTALMKEIEEQLPLYIRKLSADAAFRDAAPTTRQTRDALVEPLRAWWSARAAEGRPLCITWNQLAMSPPNEFAARWDAYRQAATTTPPGSEGERLLAERLTANPPVGPNDVIAQYATILQEAQQKWQETLVANAGATSLDHTALEEWRQLMMGAGSPASIISPELANQSLNQGERESVRALERAVAEWNVLSPGAPVRAMVMVDNPNPHDGTVFVRGNPGRPGKVVPRRFLTVLNAGGPDVSADSAPRFTKGSGRLELAEAIVSPQNPLTARVIANRLWQHYFGTGLVATASDFGVRGEPPSHPQLLDYLASELISSGWSLKHLHRLILTSATYQQKSLDNAAARAVDPENRLLWKMPRKRLEFEPLRDSWLFVAGRLDTSSGGPPVNNFLEPDANRRTLYAFINRNELPGTLRNFDFADPDSSSPGRPQTTVPQQALFGMNSPFVRAQAKAVATLVSATVDAGGPEDVATRQADKLYERVLARRPRAPERERMQTFLSGPSSGTMSRLEEAAQVLLMSNEFAFAD